MWAITGAVAMFVTIKVPYHRWRRLIPLIVAGALALMVLPFVPGLGRSVNEAKAWVFIGSVGFQPSAGPATARDVIAVAGSVGVTASASPATITRAVVRIMG